LALRFFLMRTHYKSDVNHSDKALEIASNRVYYIYQVICLDFNIYDFFVSNRNLTYFCFSNRILNLTLRSLAIFRSNNISLGICFVQTLYDCDETVSLYREENTSVPVPAEEQKLVDNHHKAFLECMSDDLRTTDVLDGFMELLKAINSNLNDLKVCQCCFFSRFWCD
jgi:cysteinyl-tRNA synthetase